MPLSDETILSATTYIRGLCRAGSPKPSRPYSLSPSDLPYPNFEQQHCKLVGPQSPAKDALEAELSALAQRIHRAEARAESLSNALPDTPNESPHTAPSTAHVEDATQEGLCLTKAQHQRQNSLKSSSASSNRSARLTNLLAARDSRPGDLARARTVSEEDISYLRDHVHRQAEQIQSQRDTITGISQRLTESDERAQTAFHKVKTEDVDVLERELQKHQQANEAFQKALREIGGIITQVANGDLSMRVQVQSSELDAEIATFKRTINTMMDQLEVFGSEVSRVAREVGTEGILGGQAQISGVEGIWKELTENGTWCSQRLLSHAEELCCFNRSVGLTDQ